jgi:Cu(I)/Ag(I) efflux system membrane protein CusA/SilA
MQRIAAPMIGGVVISAVLSLLLIPIFYGIYEKRRINDKKIEPLADSHKNPIIKVLTQ